MKKTFASLALGLLLMPTAHAARPMNTEMPGDRRGASR